MATTASAEVLADTSVLIEYLRARDPAYSAIDALLDADRVWLEPLVIGELLQGCRSCHEVRAVSDLVLACRQLENSSRSWLRAGQLSRLARSAGHPVGLADCYLAVQARASGLQLYTFDHHFELLRPHLRFRMSGPEAL